MSCKYFISSRFRSKVAVLLQQVHMWLWISRKNSRKVILVWKNDYRKKETICTSFYFNKRIWKEFLKKIEWTPLFFTLFSFLKFDSYFWILELWKFFFFNLIWIFENFKFWTFFFGNIFKILKCFGSFGNLFLKFEFLLDLLKI